MAHIKSVSGKSPIRKIVNYVTNKKKTNDNLISGYNCDPENVKSQMNFTKIQFNKTDGLQYYHIIQSFKPGEITTEKAHELGKELAEKIAKNYEVLIVTHIDKEHIHNHFVVNSVSCENGKKFQVERGAYKIKKESDKLCERENLSIIDPKVRDKSKRKVKDISSNEYRAAINPNVEWWKKNAILDVRECKFNCKSKEEFISRMESKGYKIKWKDTQRSITFTTPDGRKVRDNKLHDENLLRGALEDGFKQFVRKEYDSKAERNLSESKRTAESGIIARATSRVIEGSKQELSGAENNISKLTGADIYTELSKQGASKGNSSINRESEGAARTDTKEPGGIGEQLQRHSDSASTAYGKIYEVSSQGSTARGIQESTKTREIENNISGKNNTNDARNISNINNMPSNDISNNLYREIEKKKDLNLER